MKKIIMLILTIIILFMVSKKNDYVVIPNESIRIRIIASSNNLNDVYNKKILKDKLENKAMRLVESASNLTMAKDIINKNLDNINNEIKEVINDDYKLSFGKNYFPKKIYRGLLYEEGYYDSLVITLGSGMGNNWWCVLYPPLCLLEDNTTASDVEFRFYIKDILSKL